MKKGFSIERKYNSENFINNYFDLVNKFLLKEPLSKRKLEVLIDIYKNRNKFTDLNGKAIRKYLGKNQNITQANLSTYYKDYKEKKLIYLDKDKYIFNPHIIIKGDVIEFKFKIIKE